MEPGWFDEGTEMDFEESKTSKSRKPNTIEEHKAIVRANAGYTAVDGELKEPEVKLEDHFVHISGGPDFGPARKVAFESRNNAADDSRILGPVTESNVICASSEGVGMNIKVEDGLHTSGTSDTEDTMSLGGSSNDNDAKQCKVELDNSDSISQVSTLKDESQNRFNFAGLSAFHQPRVPNGLNPWITNPRNYAQLIFKPTLVFFSGILMEPGLVKRVLRLNSQPAMLPATIKGFRRMQWGYHAVILPAQDNSIVQGFAYWINTAEEYILLDRYEGTHWRPVKCQISTGGKEIDGMCYQWGLQDKSDLIPGQVLSDWEAEKKRLSFIAQGREPEEAKRSAQRARLQEVERDFEAQAADLNCIVKKESRRI